MKNVFIKKITNILCRFEFANAKFIIVQTKELKKILEDRFNLNNIFVVENGTDFLSAYKKQSHKNKLFTLSFVGSLGDFHNLRQVLDILRDTEINFKFLVIGDGKYKNSYLKRYKNDKRFKFMGEANRSNVKKYIIKSDLCIASYNLELGIFNKYGFYFCPLKLLEYSSLGKPTIIYGYRNSIINRFEKMNCCIVVNNGHDLINSIINLMENRKKIGEMSTNARKISNYYSWEKAAEKTEKILKYAIKTNNK
jgi:glycosyltransferase involved in cell wall biosynthesis